MADPLRRSIAFNVVERNCRERFAEGEDGIKLYLQLLVWVRFANVREAVDEFEHRFVLYQCPIKNFLKREGGWRAEIRRDHGRRASPLMLNLRLLRHNYLGAL